jgi:hypothetical protein
MASDVKLENTVQISYLFPKEGLGLSGVQQSLNNHLGLPDSNQWIREMSFGGLEYKFTMVVSHSQGGYGQREAPTRVEIGGKYMSARMIIPGTEREYDRGGGVTEITSRTLEEERTICYYKATLACNEDGEVPNDISEIARAEFKRILEAHFYFSRE